MDRDAKVSLPQCGPQMTGQTAWRTSMAILPTTPAVVLPGEPEDELTGSRHRSAAPGDRSCGTSTSSSRARDATGGRSPARPPLQHPELMPENEDLEVLRSVVSATLATAGEETDEGADDEVEEGQHQPIVPGLSDRESGFSTPTGPSLGCRDPTARRSEPPSRATRPGVRTRARGDANRGERGDGRPPIP